MSAGMWILLIVSIILIIGGAVLLGYGLKKHEDDGEKTTNHKIFIGLGAALLIIGVVLLIFFIFKWRSNNKITANVIDTSTDIKSPSVEMADMDYRNQGFNPVNQGPGAFSPMSPYDSQGMGYQPGTPTYNPGMGYNQGMMGGPMGPNPMMNQWGY